MATKVVRTLGPHVQGGKDGISHETTFGEESGQTYIAGAPLVRDSSTKELEEWAGTTDAELIVGIASGDASGTPATDVGFYEATPDFIGEGTLINATVAVALDAAHIGTRYSLVKDGSGNWLIDVADDTTKMVIVVDAIDAIGDYNPRVKFRWLFDKMANFGNAA